MTVNRACSPAARLQSERRSWWTSVLASEDTDPLSERPRPEGTNRAAGELPVARACTLTSTSDAAKLGREFAAGVLSEWALSELADDVTLVVSELVTNALRHGGCSETEQIRLTMVRHGRFVVCIVTDRGPGAPAPKTDESGCPLPDGGRGLHIVEALCAVWGWTPLPGRSKAVWAAFSLPGA